MHQQPISPRIGTSTYNKRTGFRDGITCSTINGIECIDATCTFNPSGLDADKSPHNVSIADPNFQELLQHKKTLQKMIVFAGKKDSGALEIIALFCRHFDKDQLFFILCDHDLNEKEQILVEHSIPRENYIVFKDGHVKCQENWALLGMTHAYAAELQQ